MSITYSYDVGSISHSTQNFCIKIPESILDRKVITYHEIIDLLTSHHAYPSKSSTISLYDNSLKAYRRLKESSTLEAIEGLEIKILVKDCIESEIGHLIDKINDLRKRVKGLDQRIGTQEGPFAEKIVTQDIDMAFLYSAPLIRLEGVRTKDCLEWNFDFPREHRELLNAFKQNKIEAKIRFEIATLENLSTMLYLKPKIIHISCHGYHLKDYRKGEFVLAFESSKKIGFRDEVNETRLRSVLSQHKDFNGLVVLSACYSQAIANVFLEAGVKCVVAIHEKCKIFNEAAIKFCVIFYRNLFNGKTIRAAFTEAKNGLAEIESNWDECCCVHLHEPFCKGKNLGKKLHDEHTPTSECLCEKRAALALHNIDCVFALEFNKKFNSSRVPTEEELKTGQWMVCCCSPKIPHYNSLKFKLLKKNNEDNEKILLHDFKVFEANENQGYEIDLKPLPVNEKVVGRAEEIKVIMQFFSGNHRILMIHGRAEIGKTLLINYVAKYAFDRKLFKDGVVYLDMKDKNNISSINKMLAKRLNSPWEKSNEQITRLIDRMHILVIIDGVNTANHSKLEELKAKITTFHERTQYPKFCLVLQKKIENYQVDSLEVLEIEGKSAVALIKSKIETNLYNAIQGKNLLSFAKKIDCSPKNILDIIPLIKEGLPLAEIEQKLGPNKYRNAKYRNSMQTNSAIETEPLNLFLAYLRARSPESINFLRLLNHFPGGVYKSGLNFLCKDETYNYEDIIKVISGQQSRLLDMSDLKIVLDDSLRMYLSLEGKQKTNINGYAYLAMMARHILVGLLKQPSVQCLDILKSVTNLYIFPSQTPEDNLIDFDDLSPLIMFKAMKKNFYHFLSDDVINGLNEQEVANVSEYVYEICLYLVRIYMAKNKKKRMKKADSVIKKTKSLIKRLSQHTIIAKLLLIQAAILYENQGNTEKLEKFVKKALLYFDHHKILENLGESYLLLALFKIRHSISASPLEIDEIINDAEKTFAEIQSEIGLSRTYLVKASWYLKTSRPDQSLLEILQFSKSVFIKNHYKVLEVQTIFYIGEFFYYTDKCLLAEIQFSEGLNLAIALKDRKKEIEFKEKLDLTFKRIRENSKNVIAVLRAYPIAFASGSQTSKKIFCTHFSDFKENLVKSLIEDQKIICLRFEIGTRTSIVSQIELGCRALHIYTTMPHKNALVLENSDYSADMLSFESLKDLLGNKLQHHGVELVVLAMPFSEELGVFFHEELKVANVICFDYTQYMLFDYLSQLQIMFEDSIEAFCTNFYHYLIQGKTVKEAWEVSRVSSDDFIRKKKVLLSHLRNSDHDPNELYRGKGPILIGGGEKALFSERKQHILASEAVLEQGKLVNLSSTKPPTNIEKKSNCFVGRYTTLHEIINILTQDRIVHVIGQQGIGKTKLVKHIGVYLNGRSRYKEGIFYENLRGSSSLTEFFKLLEKEGFSFANGEFFLGKNILLIIDDCDDLLRDFSSPFVNTIKKFHENPLISIIIVSNPIKIDYECRQVEIKPLQPLESVALLLAVLKKDLNRNEVIDHNSEMNIAQDLTDSNLLKDCMGIPSNIVSLAEKLLTSNFRNLMLERAENLPKFFNEPTNENELEHVLEFVHSKSDYNVHGSRKELCDSTSSNPLASKKKTGKKKKTLTKFKKN